jgi:hypothetical protein
MHAGHSYDLTGGRPEPLAFAEVAERLGRLIEQAM